MTGSVINDTHCGVLKVIKTVVCENEPSSLPSFNTAPCGANSQNQKGLARRRDEEKERRAPEAPSGAADRQTDVWADRQMTASGVSC